MYLYYQYEQAQYRQVHQLVQMVSPLALIVGAVAVVSGLQETAFPITLRLCAYHLDGDNERFEKVGYEDEEKMFLGQSNLNGSQFGWSGHGVDMEASGEIFYELSPNYLPGLILDMLRATNWAWSSLVQSVEFGPDLVPGKDISWSTVPKIHGCTTFDPNDYFHYEEGGELFLSFAKTYNLGLSVYIEDAGVTVSRALKINSKAYTGAKLSVADLSQTWNKKFLLTVQQTTLSNCVEYPSSEFSSYKECDDAFLSEVCQALKVRPFWAAANLSLVTRETVRPDLETELKLWDLFDGSRLSDCPLPCLATSVRGSEIAEWRTNNKHSTLAFSFDWDLH